AADVPPEEVRDGVVRDEHVHPSVQAEIDGKDAQTFARRGTGNGDSRALRDVTEGAVALIEEARIRSAAEAIRVAVARQVARVASASLLARGIVVEIVRDVEIEPAIPVGIEERGARAPGGAGHSGARGDVDERAVSLVSIEDVRAVVRDIEIEVAVVVVVADREAETITLAADSSLLGDVDERAVAHVSIEPVRSIALLGRATRRGVPVDEVEVEMAVAIVVEPPRAAGHRLEED